MEAKQGRIQDRLLLYFNTNKPHSCFFFLQNTSCIRKPQVISGGVRTSCTLPLDPPLPSVVPCSSLLSRRLFVSQGGRGEEKRKAHDGMMGRWEGEREEALSIFRLLLFLLGCQREPLRRRESLQSFPCLSTRREHLSVVLPFPKVSVLESLLYHNYSPCLIFAQTQRTPYSIS